MKDKWINGFGLGINYLATASQGDEVLRYIQLGLSIIATLVVIISNLVKWYKDAKKDGKITKEEGKEGINIIIDGAKDIKNAIDENGGKNDEQN